MNLLLDTHAFLWLVGEPSKLPGRLLAALADTRNWLAVSAASAMEVSTKVRIGKLPTAAHLAESQTWAARVRQVGASPLPITHEDAILAGRLSWDHRDPFDRFLAAQALLGDMTLVSRDQAFAALSGLRTLWDGPEDQTV